MLKERINMTPGLIFITPGSTDFEIFMMIVNSSPYWVCVKMRNIERHLIAEMCGNPNVCRCTQILLFKMHFLDAMRPQI
jgi:hypothetical protein